MFKRNNYITPLLLRYFVPQAETGVPDYVPQNTAWKVEVLDGQRLYVLCLGLVT